MRGKSKLLVSYVEHKTMLVGEGKSELEKAVLCVLFAAEG